MTEEKKTKHQSRVGTMLFLVRCSRPNVLNAVRDLSKFLSDSTTVDHRKVMRQTMNLARRTKNRGMRVNPVMDATNPKRDRFKTKGRSDSNHSTDIETRKSVSVLEVTLNNATVAMQSVGQKIIALSVTEVELIALALMVQEITCVVCLLESIGLKVQKPMTVQSDNKGAIICVMVGELVDASSTSTLGTISCAN